MIPAIIIWVVNSSLSKYFLMQIPQMLAGSVSEISSSLIGFKKSFIKQLAG
jgi:hypothetical protein